MEYKNIKKMLRSQIKNKTKNLWTWDKEDNNFTMLYKIWESNDKIYTPTQLLEEIDNEIKHQKEKENEKCK